LNLVTTRQTITTDDLKLRLDQLTTAQWNKLGAVAAELSWGMPFTAEDLLQEALTRALAGKRNCPADVEVTTFLIGAMKSIVCCALKIKLRDPIFSAIDLDQEELGDSLHPKNLDTPEAMLIAKQKLEQIEDLFKDNEMDTLILMAKMQENYSPAEIQEMLGLTKVQYESALTAIRRKSNKLLDGGTNGN
jgi:DNA-directed RNA polymerase specialized sigma24 family protein